MSETDDEKLGFGKGELALIKWQFQFSGDFMNALFAAMTRADKDNLRRLGEGFPEEAEAFKRYRDEPGYWDGLEARWVAGER